MRENHSKVLIHTVDTDVVALQHSALTLLGLPLVLVRVSSTLLFMRWPEHWGLMDLLFYQCSMPLLDVTQCQALEVEAKGLHGTLEKLMKLSLQRSVP